MIHIYSDTKKVYAQKKVSSNIAAADKKIVFGTGDGTVYVLSKQGEIVEAVALDDSSVWVCVISNKKLFVGQENGFIYCFE